MSLTMVIETHDLTRSFGSKSAVRGLNLQVPAGSIYGFLQGAWPFGLVEAIDPVVGTGRVNVGGDDWAARSGVPVPAGSEVEVVGADGIVLLVAPVGATRPA